MTNRAQLMVTGGVVFLTTLLASSVVIGYQAAYNLFPARPTATAREAAALLEALKDCETGQRGFLITGREVFLEPYENGAPAVGLRVSNLVAAAPKGDRLVAAIAELTRQKMEEMAGLINDRRADGAVDIEFGKVTMDEIRARVAIVLRNEERKVSARAAVQAAVSVLAVAVFVALLATAAPVWPTPPRVPPDTRLSAQDSVRDNVEV